MRTTDRHGAIASVVRGALSGAAATVAMSAVMLVAQRAGRTGTLPPKRIVERAADATGTPASPDEEGVLAGAAHLAFGAVAGAAFGAMVHRLRPAFPEAVALPWAMIVWLVSYFGWIPALGILPPPTEDRAGRAWTMFIAHLVYGASLGLLWRWLSRR